jgi:hypothetical protein
MAAGLGFKDFTTGEVLTAADVDGYLMQGIWVFASAAARDAAVTSPQEGNACYLKDTNQVLTYSGSAWVAVGGGSPLTTKGDLYGFSTVDARIPIGANDTVLTADSTQALGLKWAAASSGKVVQIVSANHSTVASNSTNTYAATGLTATITPSSASNKILIWANIAEAHKSNQNANNQIQLGLKRGSTYLKETLGLYTGSALSLSVPYSTIVYLDSPATTSATTYAVDFLNYNNTAAVKINDNMALFSTVGSSIILMEVTP